MSVSTQIEKAARNLLNSRRSVMIKGGEVGATPIFDNLANEILSIPAGDTSFVLVENTDTAREKQILTGAAKYASIDAIGGMTYKGDTFVATLTEVREDTDYGITLPTKFEFEYVPSIPFQLPAPIEYGGHSFTVVIDASEFMGQGYERYNLTPKKVYLNDSETPVDDTYNFPADVVIRKIKGSLDDSGRAELADIPVGTQFVCTPDFTSMDDGRGFDIPAPLRDTKVTAINSYKADGSLIKQYPLPQSLIDAQTGKGIGAYSDIVDLENGKFIAKTKTIKLADIEGLSSVRYNSTLDGNAFISDSGLVGFKSYSVNDFLLSKTNAFLCNVLPPTTDWQCTTRGVNLQKMSNGNHYINLAIPITALGITSSATSGEIATATIAWLKANDATLIYALEVPTEGALDTTAFERYIEVEAGGTIEFITDSGEVAPSKISYIRRVE